MIFDTIIQSAIHTWGLMWATPVIPVWFVATTIAATMFAMKINHLDGKRWLFYAFLSLILFFGSEGSKIHYVIAVAGLPPTNPAIWAYPVFGFTFWTCIIIGVSIGYLINKSTDLFFDDFNLSVATYLYQIGEGYLRRSKAFKILGVTSIGGLQQLASEQTAHKVAADLVETAGRAADELKIVAETTAERLSDNLPPDDSSKPQGVTL